MTERGSDWSRVRELFERALDLPPDERGGFLANECGEDRDLLRRVERLLAADRTGDTGATSGLGWDAPFDAGLLRDVATEDGDVAGALVGRSIGGFQTTAVLGAGGMGVVLLAEQDQPRREVALKVLAGSLVGEAARRRFAYEAEVLGQLRHPNIAQVLASGSDRDPATGQAILWIAMELVAGARPVDRFAVERHLGLAARVDLLLEACGAVAHGHRRGVLHRDLKPGNVLVGRDERLVVIDFGIARAIDGGGGGQTLTGQVLGTPRYMSPEQFAGRPEAVDTRTDVFALGVMLFELVAGRPPRDPASMTLDAFAREVMESEPPSLAACAEVPRDLDWIARRAMARRPEDRYAGADALAADLRRYRQGFPVEAGPPSTLYVLRRFVRRHRAAVAFAAIALVALLAGAGAATWGWIDAARSAEIARAEAATQATVARWMADLFAAARTDRGGRDVRVVDLLAAGEARLVELAGEPAEVDAAIRNAIAQSWISLGEGSRAQQVLDAGRDRRERELPEGHSDRAEAHYLTGLTALDAGELDLARRELERALALRLGRAGSNPVAAVTLEVAHVRHALARLAALEGDGEGARAGFAEVERLFAERLGPSHEKTLGAIRDRVDTAHRLGDYDAVRADLERALAQSEGRSASDPLRMHLRISAANDARQRGDLDRAEELYGEALAAAHAIHGEGSAKAREVLNNLAVVRQDRGDFAGAIAAFSALVAAHDAAADAEPLQALIARNNLASTRLRAGQPAEARADYDTLLDEARGTIPDAHWLRAMFLRGRGAALTELDEFEAAERDLLAAVEVLAASLGDANPRCQRALESTVALYERWGKEDRAAAFRARLADPGAR